MGGTPRQFLLSSMLPPSINADARCIDDVIITVAKANESMRDFFIDKLVTPLAEAPTIDGVFYDCFNFAYVALMTDPRHVLLAQVHRWVSGDPPSALLEKLTHPNQCSFGSVASYQLYQMYADVRTFHDPSQS